MKIKYLQMFNSGKKGILGLIFTPVFWVVLAIILVVVLLNNGLSGFTLGIFDAESQLKQEYTTIWADITDGQAETATITKENNAFTYSGSLITSADGTAIQSSNAMPAQVTFKHNFYGQEVAVLASIYGGAINGDRSLDTNGEETIFLLVPKTFDPSEVVVYQNGVQIKTLKVANPFYLSFKADSYPNYLKLSYIGYKVQFACDLASDEVWIRESFAQQFSISDLNFRPTKFCDNERPFTLRNIAQGETKISLQEGIIPLNRGEIIPPRVLNVGEIVTINYATPNVLGVTNVCQPDQANIKVAGVWICSQVIEKTTIIREVPIRELLPVTSVNSFTFTSSETKGSFNIGSQSFKTAESYACALPVEGSTVRPPSPEGCYETLISYDAKQQTLKDKQIVSLSPNMDVQFFASGSVTGGDTSKLDGLYVFALKGDALNINAEGGVSFDLNQPKSINIVITNNLPQNNIILKVTQKVIATNQIMPSQELSINANEGVNTALIEVNTENLGINQIALQAFYPIDADARVLLPSDKVIINTEVLQKGQDSIVQFIEVEKIIEKEKVVKKIIEKEKVVIVEKEVFVDKEGFLSRLWRWLKSLFS